MAKPSTLPAPILTLALLLGSIGPRAGDARTTDDFDVDGPGKPALGVPFTREVVVVPVGRARARPRGALEVPFTGAVVIPRGQAPIAMPPAPLAAPAPPAPPAPIPRALGIVLGQEAATQAQSFDAWVFGARGAWRNIEARLEAQLALYIEQLGSDFVLTPAQVRSLTLAGEGDLQRIRRAVQEARNRLAARPLENEELSEFLVGLTPLRTRIRDHPFGDGSIFAKTVRSVLKPDQLAAYETRELERQRERSRAITSQFVTTIGRAIALDTDQRRKVIDLMVEAPRSFHLYGNLTFQYGLYRLSQVPESRLRAVLVDRQWATLQHLIRDSRPTFARFKAEERAGERDELDGDASVPTADPRRP